MYDVMCTHYSVCGERFTKRNNSKGRYVEIKHLKKRHFQRLRRYILSCEHLSLSVFKRKK